MLFDSHVHSSFSGDSEMPAGAACEKAVNNGLQGIAFTDHLDFDYPEYDDVFNIDFKQYSEFMDRLKVEQKNGFKVLMGIEVGIQPHVLNETLKVVKGYNFDYVLASIHILDGIDPYKRDYYNGKTKKEAYERYLQLVLYMIRNFDDFDNVGHFEYIIRYAGYDDRSIRYKEHEEIFDEILKELINRGKGFEVNTGSFREKPGILTASYDLTLLKRYKELGGDLISLGSDAHNEEYIGYKFNYFRDMLLDAGFKNTVHFEKRKPVFDKL
jgi:histidinol-phosphatase (PHP family)